MAKITAKQSEEELKEKVAESTTVIPEPVIPEPVESTVEATSTKTDAKFNVKVTKLVKNSHIDEKRQLIENYTLELIVADSNGNTETKVIQVY